MNAGSALLLAVALAASGAAPAQTQQRSATVYRCGPEGRDLRDSPCPARPAASGSRVDYDQPSAGDSRAARERAIAEARHARELEQARLRADQEARRHASHATGIHGVASVPPPTAASSAQPATLKPPRLPKPAKTPRPARAASASG